MDRTAQMKNGMWQCKECKRRYNTIDAHTAHECNPSGAFETFHIMDAEEGCEAACIGSAEHYPEYKAVFMCEVTSWWFVLLDNGQFHSEAWGDDCSSTDPNEVIQFLRDNYDV